MPIATNILILKPMPTSAADARSQCSRAVSSARKKAQTARSNASTKQLSVLFERSTATLTGFTARKSAASRPGGGSEMPSHQGIEHSDPGEPLKRLRQQDAEFAETEDLCA